MDDLKTREAAAIAAALLLARFAHLRFDRDPHTPVMPLAYLQARSARLLLVPTVDEHNREGVNRAMVAHGCDALIVHAAGDRAEDIRFRIALHTPHLLRSGPLRLWLGASAPAHFVPDEPDDTTFALERIGLRGCEVAPWDDTADLQGGFLLGTSELARVLESTF